jgi:hypothetical protein
MDINERIKLANSIGTLRLTSWREFSSFADQVPKLGPQIFRGQQSSDWRLDTRFDRTIRQLPAERKLAREVHLKDHLENFRQTSRGRRGHNPPNITEDVEWWALGQHWGLSTPLIDWTESPYVALFFAFEAEDLPNQTSDRVVFALPAALVKMHSEMEGYIHKRTTEVTRAVHVYAKTVEQKHGDIPPADKEILTRLEPMNPPAFVMVRSASEENQRLISQRALSLLLLSDESIEDWIQNKSFNSNVAILTRILIPNTERGDCLRALNRMNINHASLFPDLVGACNYCNSELQVGGMIELNAMERISRGMIDSVNDRLGKYFDKFPKPGGTSQ